MEAMKGIRIRVLFLGPAGALTGRLSDFCELPNDATLGALKQVLCDKYPGLRNTIGIVRFAVNKSFADNDEHTLYMDDEVALVPPVSGGSDGDCVWVELRASPLPAAEARAFVGGDPACGAIVLFEGAVRTDIDVEHGPIRALSYESYAEMARNEMRRIATDARRRWATGRVALLHRTGVVPPTETSVVVAVASGHRAEAFEACRWIIDTLKRDVPIWKKDLFAGGAERWVDPNGTRQGRVGAGRPSS